MIKYTLYPLEDIMPSHDGFAMIFIASVIFLLILILYLDFTLNVKKVIFSVLVINILSGCYSFIWSDQKIKKMSNSQLVGKFVKFSTEKVIQKKRYNYYNTQTYNKEKTNHFVEYEVEGSMVLFPANLNQKYPKRVIVYKNILSCNTCE